ncbi:MAG: helix-turn-helix transcriptional regulator [Microbispora sp.]|nr:helix-turn-helix transcriptional regulator [Microbispora sp.]
MTTRDDPRNARSRRTRAALLAATRALLEEEGFEGLTMGAVAERANVSRRALYLHFASRTELVTSLFDYLAEQEGLSDSLRGVWDAPDAIGTLKEWARHMARYAPRLFAIDRAVNRVWWRDADVARHRDRVVASQRRNARMLAERLREEGLLAPTWTVDTAEDMLWALMSTDVVERLITARGWSKDQFADRYFALLYGTFVAPDRSSDPAGADLVIGSAVRAEPAPGAGM